jgi:hypothetical protein
MRISEERYRELMTKRANEPKQAREAANVTTGATKAPKPSNRTTQAKKARPRPQHTPGRMNKTEARYLQDVIEPRLKTGEYRSAKFEAVKLRLADRTFYTPDFAVVNDATGEIELHEVKGGWIEDDAMVKFKTAAAMFPEYRWKLVQQKKTTGPWETLRDI